MTLLTISEEIIHVLPRNCIQVFKKLAWVLQKMHTPQKANWRFKANSRLYILSKELHSFSWRNFFNPPPLLINTQRNIIISNRCEYNSTQSVVMCKSEESIYSFQEFGVLGLARLLNLRIQTRILTIIKGKKGTALILKLLQPMGFVPYRFRPKS